jgi:hypothetical protein
VYRDVYRGFLNFMNPSFASEEYGVALEFDARPGLKGSRLSIGIVAGAERLNTALQCSAELALIAP